VHGVCLFSLTVSGDGWCDGHLATTYAESVISTPNPMQNGMTYIVRPAIHPWYRSVSMPFIAAGAIQP
jgi:hypothetical protein